MTPPPPLKGKKGLNDKHGHIIDIFVKIIGTGNTVLII